MGLYYFISSFLPAPVTFHFNLKILLGCFQCCDEWIYFFLKGFPELTHSPTLKITTDSNERAHFQCEFTQLAADVNYIVEFYVNGKMAANVTNTSSPVTVEETDIGDLTYGNSVSTGSVNQPSVSLLLEFLILWPFHWVHKDKQSNEQCLSVSSFFVNLSKLKDTLE